MRTPRSRRETRSAFLNYVWCSGGSFRPELVHDVSLTDASISRLAAVLRAEGLIEEVRRTAPYQGGPSGFLTLGDGRHVAALEFASGRMHLGVGTLRGSVLHSEWFDLPDGARSDVVRATVQHALRHLACFVTKKGIQPCQLAVSIPGYHAHLADNPIVALHPDPLLADIRAALPGVPHLLANSIVTRAVAHRLTLATGLAGGPYLYVFVGHGVGAALVGEFAGSGDVLPWELGHTVLDPRGAQCRCGHRGCVESVLSTASVAPVIGLAEQELLAMDGTWADCVGLPGNVRADLLARLRHLGIVIGNALNVSTVRRITVAGWPGQLGGEAHAAILDGIGTSLFGGVASVDLTLADVQLGKEPAASLALATHAYLRRGAMPSDGETVDAAAKSSKQ